MIYWNNSVVKLLTPIDPTKPPISVKVTQDRWGNPYAQSDRVITPYELRVRYAPIPWTYNDLFVFTYSKALTELVSNTHGGLMSYIKKDDMYHSAVILGLEHGIVFAEDSY